MIVRCRGEGLDGGGGGGRGAATGGQASHVNGLDFAHYYTVYFGGGRENEF